MFDSGSQRTYITESLRDKLNLKPARQERIHLNTFGDINFSTRRCDVVHICLQKPGLSHSIRVSALCFPVICSSLPSPVTLMNCPHLEGLELADQLKGSQDAIDMLIGLDFCWTIVMGDIRHSIHGPVAISSKLGWLLSGPISTHTPVITSSHLIIQGLDGQPEGDSEQLVMVLKDFWKTEAIGITDNCQNATEDEHFLEEIKFLSGRYEVKLPWKMQVIDIPNQYDLSLNRLKFLQRRLMKNPEILTEYDRIIRDQLSAGIIEIVSEPSLTESNGHIHYLPHHAVIRQGRQTTKI